MGERRLSGPHDQRSFPFPLQAFRAFPLDGHLDSPRGRLHLDRVVQAEGQAQDVETRA